MLICKQKINLIPQFFLEILHLRESWNLIDQEHFGNNSRTRILSDMTFAMESQD